MLNKEKLNANVVGVVAHSDPQTNKITKFDCRGGRLCPPANKQNGITLIALIITIIVMVILVAVTVSAAINGGIFNKATDAAAKKQREADREELQHYVVGAYDAITGIIDETKLREIESNGWDEIVKEETAKGIKYTCRKTSTGNEFVIEDGKIEDYKEIIMETYYAWGDINSTTSTQKIPQNLNVGESYTEEEVNDQTAMKTTTTYTKDADNSITVVTTSGTFEIGAKYELKEIAGNKLLVQTKTNSMGTWFEANGSLYATSTQGFTYIQNKKFTDTSTPSNYMTFMADGTCAPSGMMMPGSKYCIIGNEMYGGPTWNSKLTDLTFEDGNLISFKDSSNNTYGNPETVMGKDVIAGRYYKNGDTTSDYIEIPETGKIILSINNVAMNSLGDWIFHWPGMYNITTGFMSTSFSGNLQVLVDEDNENDTYDLVLKPISRR